MKYLLSIFIILTFLCNQTIGLCKNDNNSSVDDDFQYEFSDEIVKSEVIVKFKGFYSAEARKNYISGLYYISSRKRNLETLTVTGQDFVVQDFCFTIISIRIY